MSTSKIGEQSATASVSDLEGDGHRFIQQTSILGSVVAICTVKNEREGFFFRFFFAQLGFFLLLKEFKQEFGQRKLTGVKPGLKFHAPLARRKTALFAKVCFTFVPDFAGISMTLYPFCFP